MLKTALKTALAWRSEAVKAKGKRLASRYLLMITCNNERPRFAKGERWTLEQLGILQIRETMNAPTPPTLANTRSIMDCAGVFLIKPSA